MENSKQSGVKIAFSRGKKPNCPYVQDPYSKFNPLVLNMSLSKKKVPSVSKILWQGKMFIFASWNLLMEDKLGTLNLWNKSSACTLLSILEKKKLLSKHLHPPPYIRISKLLQFLQKSHTCHNQAASKDSSHYNCCRNQARSKHMTGRLSKESSMPLLQMKIHLYLFLMLVSQRILRAKTLSNTAMRHIKLILCRFWQTQETNNALNAEPVRTRIARHVPLMQFEDLKCIVKPFEWMQQYKCDKCSLMTFSKQFEHYLYSLCVPRLILHTRTTSTV